LTEQEQCSISFLQTKKDLKAIEWNIDKIIKTKPAEKVKWHKIFNDIISVVDRAREQVCDEKEVEIIGKMADSIIKKFKINERIKRLEERALLCKEK